MRNPQGATRLARALASEIVAVGAVAGERAAGKIDRHSVSNAIRLYESAEGGRITVREDRATREGGKRKLFGREGKGRTPSPTPECSVQIEARQPNHPWKVVRYS